MLPRPATTVWSRSAALRLVFLWAHAAASRLASKALPSGSGPTSRMSGWLAKSRRGTISIRPNRGGSLDVTGAPGDIWDTPWGAARAAGRGGAELGYERMGGEVGGRHDQHQAEPARIVVCHRGAGRHMEHHVVMGRGRGACMMELARHRSGILVAHAERAGHAEMHQQHVPGSKVRRQVLGPPPAAGNSLPFHP